MMKVVKKLSDSQRQLLVSLENARPDDLMMDDIMHLGGHGLIEFAKGGGIQLTKKGRKVVEVVSK